jgi:hypothetical protein
VGGLEKTMPENNERLPFLQREIVASGCDLLPMNFWRILGTLLGYRLSVLRTSNSTTPLLFPTSSHMHT